MKNTSLHIILTPILAVCVLLATCSFTLNKRFCGESLVEASLFADLQQCKHTTCATVQAKKNNSQKINNNCCKETSDVVYGQENLVLKKNQAKRIKAQSQGFLNTKKVFSVFLPNYENEDSLVFYTPPLLAQKNLLQYYQVFII